MNNDRGSGQMNQGYPQSGSYSGSYSGFSYPQQGSGQFQPVGGQYAGASQQAGTYPYAAGQAAPQAGVYQAQAGYQTWNPMTSGSSSGYQGGYASGMPNGAQAPAGYTGSSSYNRFAPSQPAQPYTGQGSFSQGGNGYAPQPYQPQNGYSWPAASGYPQGTQPGYPQNAQGGAPLQTGNSFIPQTPYSTGYAAGGAPGQNPYSNSYPVYQGGAGRTAPQGGVQSTTGQIPLNGGGYVPQPVHVRRPPFEFNDIRLIALSGILLILFLVGWIVPVKALLWVFLALTAASCAMFWLKPMIEQNKRLCFTVVFGALSVAALVIALSGPPAASSSSGGSDNTTSRPGQETSSVQPTGNSGSTAQVSTGTAVNGLTGQTVPAGQVSTYTQSPPTENEETPAAERLRAFFYFWSANKLDDMLDICAPSWKSDVDEPKAALFRLLANRVPLDYAFEKISGTNEDTSRTITLTSTMDKNNGKKPVKFRFAALMLHENGTWYVDPQSLKTFDEDETPDPSITATPAPTPEPVYPPSTVLYYNPSGGTKYHLDPNCKSTHAKYLPMQGHFTYAEVNDPNYKDLMPCNVCAAPLR